LKQENEALVSQRSDLGKQSFETKNLISTINSLHSTLSIWGSEVENARDFIGEIVSASNTLFSIVSLNQISISFAPACFNKTSKNIVSVPLTTAPSTKGARTSPKRSRKKW
jgi:hypothetical protein